MGNTVLSIEGNSGFGADQRVRSTEIDELENTVSKLLKHWIGGCFWTLSFRGPQDNAILQLQSPKVVPAGQGRGERTLQPRGFRRTFSSGHTIELRLRDLDNGEGSPSEIDVLMDLLSQVFRAYILAKKYRAAVQLLSKLAVSFALVDEEGREILSSAGKRPLQISSCKSSNPQQRNRIVVRDLIREARNAFAKNPGGDKANGRYYFRSLREDGNGVFAPIYVVPMDSSGKAANQADTYAIVSPSQSGALFLPALEKAFAMTPSEADVVRQMVAGCNVEETCRALNLSKSTVRTYLKRAYSKAGVSSRAQLVARINSLSVPFEFS